MLQPLVDNTTTQVVRSVVLSAEGKKSAHTCGIGRANVQQIESELVDENTRIIRACTSAGVHHGEYSWKIGDIAEVKVGPPSLPSVLCTERVSHFLADGGRGRFAVLHSCHGGPSGDEKSPVPARRRHRDVYSRKYRLWI
jgi:hypothetical protein